MGSKTRAPKPTKDEPREDVHDGCCPPSARSEARRLVRCIADVLEVPLAALYEPSNAVAERREADAYDASKTSLDRDCEVLQHAFRRIQDPKKRQRMLALMEEAAEQG